PHRPDLRGRGLAPRELPYGRPAGGDGDDAVLREHHGPDRALRDVEQAPPPPFGETLHGAGAGAGQVLVASHGDGVDLGLGDVSGDELAAVEVADAQRAIDATRYDEL